MGTVERHMTERPIHVVGGGIAGLVSAITAAEAGAAVVLHESADELGGRALGRSERAGVNLGPHVLFTDGAVRRWLRARGIRVGLRLPPVTGLRLLDDRGPHRPVGEVLQLAATLRRREAPVDENFREWAAGAFGGRRGDLLCRFAGLFTFHHDPGSLSARFVWDRYRRTFLSPDRVRWVAGGWSRLVGALAERAEDLGVQIERGDKVTPDRFPGGPTIVATSLSEASRLLGRRLRWPGARTALLDVVASAGADWPSLVADVRSDLSTCCMVERETAIEPELLGRRDLELFQAHLGIAPGTGAGAGVARIEDALDHTVERWREKTVWHRGHVVADSSGAVDPPGTTWRDRPAIELGEDRFLAGDAVAAPGMLSEVAVNSGVRAAHLAVAARERRTFAVAWPCAQLTPERRFAVLAEVVPSATVAHRHLPPSADDRWELEPVDETGPGYRLDQRGRVLRGLAIAGDAGDGDARNRVTTLVARRWPVPLARLAALATDRLRLGPARLGRPRRR